MRGLFKGALNALVARMLRLKQSARTRLDES